MVVCRATSSASMPLNLAIYSATRDTFAGKFVDPRFGSGAKYGESVSKIRNELEICFVISKDLFVRAKENLLEI